MKTKEQHAAAEKIQKLQNQIIKVRGDLDGNRAKMANDPMSDQIAAAITTGQVRLEALNRALDNALDEQRKLETEAQQIEAKERIKRINELETKADHDKRAVYNAIEALQKDINTLYLAAVEHNKLTNKYQGGRRGYIAKTEYKLLWQLQKDLEKLQKQKRYIDNLGKPPAPDPERKFTELQKAVNAERYHAPDEGTEVKLLENDYGTGDPVYRVKQR